MTILENIPARIHLLPAKNAPITVIIRRKPSKVFHIMRWDTRKNKIRHGSWFKGRLYPHRCDVSFDGKWMVYFALGANARQSWSGVCLTPFLKTYAESVKSDTWGGGGYWETPHTLMTAGWNTPIRGEKSTPFALKPLVTGQTQAESWTLFKRWQRDGWQRAGDNWGNHRQLPTSKYQVTQDGDDGWFWQPSRKHPMLRAFYRGYLEHGHTFEFKLDEHPELLAGASWATWNNDGQLLVARNGGVELYSQTDIRQGKPSMVHNFESLVPPTKK